MSDPEIIDSKESPQFRPFNEIQDEMASLINKPDPKRERELRQERAKLVNQARSIGVEYGVLRVIKRDMLDIQTENPSLQVAVPIIASIDTDRLEDEARGLSGWQDEFEGLINEYRDGALRNMQLQFLIKSGAPQDQIDRLRREIDLLNWGRPPAIIASMPIEPEVKTAGPVININERKLAQEIAEAQGILRPSDYLREAVDGEEFLETAQRIVPGQEPRFWGILSDKEKDEWRARSVIWVIAVKKSMAFTSDKLCMEEMHDLAVSLNKWSMQILFGDIRSGEVVGEGKDGVLPATGIYTTIIGDPKFREWIGQYKQEGKYSNEPDSAKREFPGLYNEDGTPSDINLKSVFFGRFGAIEDGLLEDYGEDGLDKLKADRDKLYKACPDSFYPHSKDWGTRIDAEGFKMLRKSVRFWLTTSGRDLLLTAEERANREAFFADKEKALDVLSFRAREAEIISWNYVYSLGLLESFDTRQFRPEGTKRHSPSNYWSLALWTTMHLQERFEQKILRENPDNDTMEGKEEWAGGVGTWALYHYDKGIWNYPRQGKPPGVKIPQLLPDAIFRSGLFNNYVFESGRAPTGEISTSKDNNALFTKFNSIGNQVLFHTNSVTREGLTAQMDWSQVSDTPFVSYIWDEIRWANTIEKAFKKGQKADKDLKDIGEAVRNLKMPREVKENLLVIYNGINVRATELTPYQGKLSYNLYAKRAMLEQFPNYFLEK